MMVDGGVFSWSTLPLMIAVYFSKFVLVHCQVKVSFVVWFVHCVM